MTDLEAAERLIQEAVATLDGQHGVPNYVRAEVCLREAVSLLCGVEDVDGALWAVAYDRLAWACDAQGRDADAETYYLRSLAAQQAAGWPPVVCDEVTLMRLSQLYGRRGQHGLQLATLSRMQQQKECSCRRSAAAFANDPGVRRVMALYGMQ
jgi:hypothetical protein